MKKLNIPKEITKRINKNCILLQVVGSTKKLGFGNDIDLRGFYTGGFKWERHDNLGIVNNIPYQNDLWNKEYAVKQIKKGLNSCPLLYSCFFGGNYIVLTEEGKELIKNRDDFRSSKLIDGCIRFCDRKIKQSEKHNQKLHKSKYVYYACSDMYEQIEILKTKDCIYPLSFNREELNLIKNLKDNKAYIEGLGWYSDLKKEILQIKL